jgi:hypothetical protein
MIRWHWLIRAVVAACALWLFMQWQSIAAQWAALFSWLLCAGGAELIIAVSPAKDRRRMPSPPRRGGRRRTDPRLD